MRKIHLIILCAGLSALALSSCTREQLTPRPEGSVTVTATREGGETKTNIELGGAQMLTWAAGDRIAVLNNGTVSEFTLASGEGQAAATFTGDIELADGDVYAWYPYGGQEVSAEAVPVDLRNQTLSAGEATGKYFYMVAKGSAEAGSTDISLSFKNPLAAFVFMVDNNLPETIELVSLKVSAGEGNNVFYQEGSINLAEDYESLAVTASGEPVSAVEVSLSDYTVDAQDGTANLPVVTLPADLTGKTLWCTLTYNKGDESGKTVTKILEGRNLVRNMLAGVSFKLSGSTVEGGMEVSAAKPGDVAGLVENAPASPVINVTVTQAPANDEENKIDLGSLDLSGVEILNITLPAIPEESAATKYRLAAPTDDARAPKAINLTVEGEDSNFRIYAPASTVTLTGGDYENVTATTAENTLVVANGVYVDNLRVVQGNVRVLSGAVINQIVRDASNPETVYAILESSAESVRSVGEGVTLMSALEYAALKGGEVALAEDVTLTSPLAVESDMVLDLNGHCIEAANGGSRNIIVTGSLTLKDNVGSGKIVATEDYTSAAYNTGIIYVSGEDAKLTVEGGTVYTVRDDAAKKGQFGVVLVNGGDFTMTGGRIEAGWYAVSGNGLNDTQNSEINISGGELISSADYAVYLPQSGTTTVSGGTVNGAAGGISIQRGTLEISGGRILSDGDGYTGEWSDGTAGQANSSLMVAAEYGDCDVTISGGEFYARGNAITIGKESSSHNVNIAVSGGTFSDGSVLPYLTEGADVTVTLEDDLALEESMKVERGSVTVDLNSHVLTAGETATVEGTTVKNQTIAIFVADGAKATVKNGKIGDSTSDLFYGVFGKGDAEVVLNNVEFSEMVTYAYNGAGKSFQAENCTFRGWLSGWGNGKAVFNSCTFTIGKAWAPAVICYGTTTFDNCKFFKNGTDPDEYVEYPDADGYYRCDYVVAASSPAEKILFEGTCNFIDESGSITGEVKADNHPYHACGGWGDGTVPEDLVVKVNGVELTTDCSGCAQSE